MKLILIRHGESAHNRGYKVAGSENNLTAAGVKQSISVGEKLVEQKIDAIYCSSKPRCVQTLDEILRLREDNMPIHLTSLVGPKHKRENYEKLKARIELFLDDVKFDHKQGETILVVSHLLAIQMMTYLITGTKRRLENGEMVEIELVISDQ
ncbi:MAG: phosphoglycerate mutase family protein [Microgenomates group bacterium]